MYKILVTGARGFIGSNICEWLRRFFTIYEVDLKNGQNICDKTYIRNLFSEHTFDIVIHLAAFPGVEYSILNSNSVLENNILGFNILAEASIKKGVSHFIYASSSSIYGDDGNPKSPYAISKKTNEMQADVYSRLGNTKFTGLRFFTVYGPHMREDLGMTKFIRSICNDEEIIINGDGNQRRDFTYVSDVCSAIETIIRSEKTWRHEIFDIGNGENTSINDLICILKNCINPNFEKIKYIDDKQYDVRSTLADTSKMYEWFGFRCKFKLKDTLENWIHESRKIYILTIIKNEHLYLEDFIKYHLNIGIDHIIIFEDIDSKTHKSITDKYKNVTLKNISEIFDEHEIKNIIQSKEQNIQVQRQYIHNCMKYVSSIYSNGWCFYIDCDEYITFEKNKNTILNYITYDALCVCWKVYGANKIINQPDYTNTNVREIFTEPLNNYNKVESPVCMYKTAYNLLTFKLSHIKSHHQPNKKIFLCKTDFSTDLQGDLSLGNIFLRHYMTKSWEEYVIKLNIRGMFFKDHRNYDMFFNINPDLISRKEELIEMIPEILNNFPS